MESLDIFVQEEVCKVQSVISIVKWKIYVLIYRRKGV